MLNDALLLAEVAAMARTEVKKDETSKAGTSSVSSVPTKVSPQEGSNTPVPSHKGSESPSLITPRFTTPANPTPVTQTSKSVHENGSPSYYCNNRSTPPSHPLTLPLELSQPSVTVNQKETSHLPLRSSFPRMRSMSRQRRYEDVRVHESRSRSISEPYHEMDYHHNYDRRHNHNHSQGRRSSGDFEPPNTHMRHSPNRNPYRELVNGPDLLRPHARRSLSMVEHSMPRHVEVRGTVDRVDSMSRMERFDQAHQQYHRQEDVHSRFSPGSHSPHRSNMPQQMNMRDYHRPPKHPAHMMPLDDQYEPQFMRNPPRRLISGRPYSNAQMQTQNRTIRRQFETPATPGSSENGMLQARSNSYEKTSHPPSCYHRQRGPLEGQPKKTILRRKCAW